MPQSPAAIQAPSHFASASSVLEHLNQFDTHSEDFARELASVLHERDFSAFASELGTHDRIVFIDFLERCLDAVWVNGELQRRCLRVLRKFCVSTLQLPTSYLIMNGLAKTSTTPLAAGGFAEVYIGSYQKRRVAMKCLRIHSRDEAQALQRALCKEVVIWKRLSHPHILPFLGISNTVSQLCMVSEWMDNGNIIEYSQAHPDSSRLNLLLDAAKGLEYLHSSHVVHTDLKGNNILIDQNGRALLADFGLASITGDPISINASTPGKQGAARWMAPELLNPDAPDDEVPRPTRASDVYAFAMVILEVFTGKVPFHQYRREVAAIKMVQGSRPARPNDTLGLGLTDEVWNMVCACWLKEPQSRPIISDVVKCLTSVVSTFEYPHVIPALPVSSIQRTLSGKSSVAPKRPFVIRLDISAVTSLQISARSSPNSPYASFTPISGLKCDDAPAPWTPTYETGYSTGLFCGGSVAASPLSQHCSTPVTDGGPSKRKLISASGSSPTSSPKPYAFPAITASPHDALNYENHATPPSRSSQSSIVSDTELAPGIPIKQPPPSSYGSKMDANMAAEIRSPPTLLLQPSENEMMRSSSVDLSPTSPVVSVHPCDTTTAPVVPVDLRDPQTSTTRLTNSSRRGRRLTSCWKTFVRGLKFLSCQ